jgi:hypothetical protein
MDTKGIQMEKKAPKKSAPTKRDKKLEPITRDEFEDFLKRVSRKTSDQAKNGKKDSD